jgi:O-antigen/teichoic acid export membrane protein
VSRVARSALSFAASAAASVVGALAAFVTTPLVLRGLGPERLGVFRVATEWAGYLALLEVGLSGALAPLLARAAATGDRQQVRSVLTAGVRAYVRVALWTLAMGGLLWAVLPQLVRVPMELDGELRLGFALAVAGSIFIPLNVYRPLAESLQKGYLVSVVLCVQALTITAGCAMAALAGWGLPGQFGVTAAGTLILPLGLLLIFRPLVQPRELLRRMPRQGEEARQLSGLNRTTLIYHLVGRVSLLSDNIIVGLFLGPGAVASFFLTTRLSQVAYGQVQTVGNATWAGLAELYHSGRHDIFHQRLTELTRVTAILGSAVVMPLAALTGPFVSLWVGPEYYAGGLVVAFAVFNGVLQPVFTLWSWVFAGLGRIGLLLPYTICQGVLNLTISLMATWLVGISGPLIGTAVVNLVFKPWYFSRLLRMEFAVSSRELFTATLLPFIPAAMILGGLIAGYTMWPGASWVRLACAFGAAAGLYFVIAWQLFVRESERRAVWRVTTELSAIFWGGCRTCPRAQEHRAAGRSEAGKG